MSGFALLTIAALAGAAAAGGAAPKPVRLEVETAADFDIVRVIAESATACSISYELAVSGGSGNRSVNRGRMTIPPAERLTLTTVKLSRAADSQSSAVLEVTPCVGKPYRLAWPEPASE